MPIEGMLSAVVKYFADSYQNIPIGHMLPLLKISQPLPEDRIGVFCVDRKILE